LHPGVSEHEQEVDARGSAREPNEDAAEEPLDDFDERLATTPHDALFRRTFSNVSHAEGELRAVLPRELTEAVDFGSLRVIPRSVVDHALRERESDILYSIRIGAREALLYVLCEHQSSADARMPLRLLGYLVRIWEQHAAHHPSAPLPPILPLVLHHDRTPWAAATSLGELLDLDEPLRRALAPFIPDFTFLLDDLAKLQPSELRERVSLTALARLVLFVLQRARHAADLVEELAAFGDQIDELLKQPAGAQHWTVLLRYILYVADPEPQRFRALVRGRVSHEAEEALMTAAERLRAEGEAKGRAEGEAKGRAEGEAKGRAALLVKQLSFKFGTLPAEIQARIEDASVEELERWAERVLSATRLDAVFAGTS
jgi:predicted transposase YdaD